MTIIFKKLKSQSDVSRKRRPYHKSLKKLEKKLYSSSITAISNSGDKSNVFI